jgi:hypothetical protein
MKIIYYLWGFKNKKIKLGFINKIIFAVDSDEVFHKKESHSNADSSEDLNDPMNRTYSKQSGLELHKQFMKYNNELKATQINEEITSSLLGAKSKLAARRPSITNTNNINNDTSDHSATNLSTEEGSYTYFNFGSHFSSFNSFVSMCFLLL